MGIRYGSREIGEVKAASVHGYTGLGLSQLRFSVSWNIFPRRDDQFTVFGTFIWVSARAEGESEWLTLGQATPETAWSDECRPGDPFERQLLYRLALPDSQLLAVENARKGRGMSFQLDVRGHVQGPDGIRSLDSTVVLQVNASDWARVLKEANLAEILLVGVHLPIADANGRSQAAVDLVRKANSHLLQGHYEDAVAQCRRAIESLWTAGKLKEQARAARKLLATMTEREAMTKLDRELALGEAILNFTHPAHHVGDDAQPEIFGRLDAAFVVAATAGLVSSLAAVHGRRAALVDKPPPGKEGSADAVSMPDLLARVRKQFARHPANRPGTMDALRSFLDTLFGKRLDAQQLNQLMSELQNQKIVAESAGNITYPTSKD